MKAGALRTKIKLQKKSEGSGIYDEVAYSDYGWVFANWKDLSSVEMLKNESLQGYRYATVVIREINIDGTYRIIKDNEEWDMLGYPRVLKPGWIEIKVQRAVVG